MSSAGHVEMIKQAFALLDEQQFADDAKALC